MHKSDTAQVANKINKPKEHKCFSVCKKDVHYTNAPKEIGLDDALNVYKFIQ